MQQTCSNCRYPLQPGSTVCTNCGQPVNVGGGSYDPTIRAGSPPGSGYGQSAYGAPSAGSYGGSQYGGPGADPYGSSSNPYGAQQGSPYGAPPPNQYGAPQPGPYGAPAGQFGAPQAPIFTPVKPARSRKGLLFGAIGLIVLCIVGIVVVSSIFGKFKQVVTTGTHVTNIQVGTGLDQTTFAIKGATDSFHTGDTVYVSFTITTQDTNAKVVYKLYSGSTSEGNDNLTPDQGTNTYGISIIVHNTDEHKFEVDYNGAPEASITFNVT